MPDRSWTLTVSYVNGVATITDGNGGTGDETIFIGEQDQVTFQPGTGVRAVTSFTVTRPIPLPTGVTVTQTLSGANCIVTDTNSLVVTANQVDVVYCINFTDTSGTSRSTDPQLINKPSIRPPTMLTPMARGARRPAARQPAKAAALAKSTAFAKTSKTAKATAKPQAKSTAKPASGKSKSRASR